MCRFVIYVGADPTSLASVFCSTPHSLVQQARQCRLRLDASQTVNADGCGIAWYTSFDSEPEACVLVSDLPAWNSSNLLRLAPKIRSRLIFAHIRASTLSRNTEAECHPFEFGNMVWMHNGSIGNWSDVRRPLTTFLPKKWHDIVQGQSDSEWAFALFLSLLEKEGYDASLRPSHGYPGEILRKVLLDTIYAINELRTICMLDDYKLADQVNFLNFAVSDGYNCVVSRYTDSDAHAAPSLYYCHGSTWDQDKTGSFGMNAANHERSAIVIASEPITQQPGVWMEVPKNSTVAVQNGIPTLQKIDINTGIKRSHYIGVRCKKHGKLRRTAILRSDATRRRPYTSSMWI